ncbi:MAG: gfo/Idh/MocA family oxidoreductase, partial [Christiangramia sp.]|nr:gfo/Idh/MocA family oxidoreductase [Christiangramia sp.]
PPSSHVIMSFENEKNKSKDIKLHWMDGGIKPMRPEELGPEETFGDGGNGALIIGNKGKMMCGTYGLNPRLLPTSKTEQVSVPQKYNRVEGGMDGHYAQWVEAAIAGYGKKELSSPFEIAGPLTESLLIANLAIRGYDIQKTRKDKEGNERVYYPGRDLKMIWDAENMKVTNFDEANQFVKRKYPEGYSL